MARDKATPSQIRIQLHLDGVSAELTDAQLKEMRDTYATLIVEEDLADTGMSNDRLTTIEACLTGHMLLSSGIDEWRQTDTERDSGGRELQFAGQYGQGLRSTSLGQRAIELDTSGTLAKMAEDGGSDWWSYTYTGRDGDPST